MNQSCVICFLDYLVLFGCLVIVILVLCMIEIFLSIFGYFNSSSESVRLEKSLIIWFIDEFLLYGMVELDLPEGSGNKLFILTELLLSSKILTGISLLSIFNSAVPQVSVVF
jgi:hypothetical protein